MATARSETRSVAGTPDGAAAASRRATSAPPDRSFRDLARDRPALQCRRTADRRVISGRSLARLAARGARARGHERRCCLGHREYSAIEPCGRAGLVWAGRRDPERAGAVASYQDSAVQVDHLVFAARWLLCA